MKIVATAMPGMWALLWAFAQAASAEGAPVLPRQTPESQGVASQDIQAFLESADREIEGMHSFMLLRHGCVIAEGWWAPYDAAHNHQLYSLSKSFTSTAVGLAQAEGKLSVDDTVLSFFPKDAPADPSPNLRAMRVRDLLSMVTGHEQAPSAAADIVTAASFLAEPVPHKPGTHFHYNTAATFMLSAIVQKRTGQTVLDYLRPRLFEPLGIVSPVWRTNRQGISLGGYGLFVRTEDIASFGQLYLQRGRWGDRQILPSDWIDAATARQVSNGSNPNSDWDQGYGYQFWRCRHAAFRGDGAFGQYCIVLPDQDAVIAITSGVKDMQAVLNLIWDRLLPAFRFAALPENPRAQDSLKASLRGLRVPTAEGMETSPRAATIFGRSFRFMDNEHALESLRLEPLPGQSGVSLHVVVDGQAQKLACGFREWQLGRSTFGPHVDEPIAGSMAWPEPNTCVVKLCAYETPYAYTLTLKFEDDTMRYHAVANVGFGGAQSVEILAKASEQ